LAPMKPAPHTVVSTRLLVVMNKPIDMLYVFGLIRRSARHLSLTSTGS
jgi:hypothetical protein